MQFEIIILNFINSDCRNKQVQGYGIIFFNTILRSCISSDNHEKVTVQMKDVDGKGESLFVLNHLLLEFCTRLFALLR